MNSPIFVSGARKMAITKAHQPLVWENMLGTVYARDPETGKIEYFDYSWDKAHEFAKLSRCTDLRVARSKFTSNVDYRLPRRGQFVLYGKYEKGGRK